MGRRALEQSYIANAMLWLSFQKKSICSSCAVYMSSLFPSNLVCYRSSFLFLSHLKQTNKKQAPKKNPKNQFFTPPAGSCLRSVLAHFIVACYYKHSGWINLRALPVPSPFYFCKYFCNLHFISVAAPCYKLAGARRFPASRCWGMGAAAGHRVPPPTFYSGKMHAIARKHVTVALRDVRSAAAKEVFAAQEILIYSWMHPSGMERQ